jgi:hypothetical protein
VTFYQFPREHWPHLRTSNVVESPFATVRLRTTAAKERRQNNFPLFGMKWADRFGGGIVGDRPRPVGKCCGEV